MDVLVCMYAFFSENFSFNVFRGRRCNARYFCDSWSEIFLINSTDVRMQTCRSEKLVFDVMSDNLGHQFID